jgi:hypothetical protein
VTIGLSKLDFDRVLIGPAVDRRPVRRLPRSTDLTAESERDTHTRSLSARRVAPHADAMKTLAITTPAHGSRRESTGVVRKYARRTHAVSQSQLRSNPGNTCRAIRFADVTNPDWDRRRHCISTSCSDNVSS